MALGDLYEARVEVNRGGNRFYNVWHFVRTQETGSSTTDFILALKAALYPAMRPLMVNTAYIASLFVRNVFNPLGFREETYTSATFPGTWGPEEPMPDYVTAVITAHRERLDMRGGRKAFSALGIGAVEGNALSLTAFGLLDTLADVASAPVEGNGSVHVPAIVKRIPYVTPSGRDAYRLPQNQGELIYYDPTYLAQSLVSSQNTRKVQRNP